MRRTKMSDESYFYQYGFDRGKSGSFQSLGVIRTFTVDEAEQRAAQRGWEAGVRQREWAQAQHQHQEASPSYSVSNSSGDKISSLGIILFCSFSCLVALTCFHFIQHVSMFSFAWWAFGTVIVFCTPGVFVTVYVLLVATGAFGAVAIIGFALYKLVLYFIQHPY